MTVCLGLICVLLLVFITLYITITAERDLLKNTVEEFNHTINSLQDNYTDLSQKKLELETTVNDLTAEKSQLQGSVDSLSQKILELETSVRDLEDKNTNNEQLFSCLLKGNGWFFISSERKSWSESRQFCRDRGADLIIINTEEKQRLITALVKEKMWIGLSDSESEGIMKWVDNSPLKKGFWYKDEPNNKNNEDCIELDPSKGPVNNWNDEQCSDKRKCICEP
ncbi:hypothetical protein PO909_016010 [Leuciscus waleckii]